MQGNYQGWHSIALALGAVGVLAIALLASLLRAHLGSRRSTPGRPLQETHAKLPLLPAHAMPEEPNPDAKGAMALAMQEARASERSELERGLRLALENEEFEVHYQPKVDIASNRVISMEALVRWRHPQKGLVPAGSFIPLAEELGLIGPLGEWVLRTACAQNRAWQRVGLRPMPVSINLSASQFCNSSLFESIQTVLAQTGLEPRYLEVEITESTVMRNPENSMRVLEQLNAIGVHTSIDDFGSTYASLRRLGRLPLNKLKIDCSSVSESVNSPADAAMVRAIVALAHSLRLQVIAEGVETAAQLDFLRSLGCDQYQGYLCSPAIDAGRFSEFVRLNRSGVPASAVGDSEVAAA